MTKNAIRMIEDEIARELDRYHSIFPDHEEKREIIQRVAELKALLPQSSPEMECQPVTASEIVNAFVTAFRRRTSK